MKTYVIMFFEFRQKTGTARRVPTFCSFVKKNNSHRAVCSMAVYYCGLKYLISKDRGCGGVLRG